jgi:predicted kinase
MKPLNLSTPHLIIMVGIPGSGKSFFAEHFATTFNAPYVSFEQIAQQVFNANVMENIEKTTEIAHYLLGQLLKTGQTIIYEGETDSRVSRQNLAKLAHDSDYEPLFVLVQTE